MDFLNVEKCKVLLACTTSSVHCAEYSIITLNQFFLNLDQNEGVTISPLEDRDALLSGVGVLG